VIASDTSAEMEAAGNGKVMKMDDIEKRLNDILDAYTDMDEWQRTVNVSEGDPQACEEADKAAQKFFTLMWSMLAARRAASQVPAVFAEAIESLLM
jgi:hypothetical protein